MNRVSLIFSILYACFFWVACQLEETATPQKASIVGNWKCYSRFLGYQNGGDFQWHNLEQERQFLLKFRSDSTYTADAYGNPISINGRYFLTDTLLTTYSTSPVDGRTEIVHTLNDSVLILKQFIDEGYTLDKFKRQD